MMLVLLQVFSALVFGAAAQTTTGNFFVLPTQGSVLISETNQNIEWETTLTSNYEIVLWQQWPSSAGQGANALTSIFSTSGSGLQEFSWALDNVNDTQIAYSNKFFLWLNRAGSNNFTSPYFFINAGSSSVSTTPTSTTSTASTTSTSSLTHITTLPSLPTSVATITATPNSVQSTTSTSSTLSLSSATTSTSTSTSAPTANSGAVAVGLGVGLGVGIPLLAVIGALSFLLARRRRAHALSQSNPGTAMSTDPHARGGEKTFSELAGQPYGSQGYNYGKGHHGSAPQQRYEFDGARPPAELGTN